MAKEKLNFAKLGGLIPAVIQDYQNNEVLMIGFMNEDAWKLTNKTGKVHYWSRKKKRLWMKGEESGHFQFVKEIYLDNDNDSLLIKVDQIGGAVEDGYRSCFYKMKRGNRFVTIGHKIFDPKKVYKNYSDTIIFAIPSGSLYSTTIMLFGLAGYQLELRGERSFKPSIRGRKDVKLVVARAEEIPHLIESEEVDIGLTGTDLVEETGVSVTDLADLQYNEHGRGPVNWVLAVPKEKVRNFRGLHDFSGKKISTELVNTTKQYFLKHNISVSIESSVGTTEAKAPFFADAIVDLCETGESLRDNGLVPLYNIRASTVHLFANNHSMGYGWKRRKIEEITEKMKAGIKKLPRNPKHFIKLPNI
jgi:ATP phosphoribosyltransferase